MTDSEPKKKSKRVSPTQRSLKRLRDEGYTCAIVEKWNPHAMIRQDLFGFADLLAIKPGIGILAVQVCSGSTLAAHRDKLYAEPRVRSWVAAGGLVEIHAWRKVGARGKRKLWDVIQESVTHETWDEANGLKESA